MLPTDIKLNTTSKFFARSFSCGLSVTGDDEIVIQGNIKDDLFDIISEKWSQASLLVAHLYAVSICFCFFIKYIICTHVCLM